LSQPYIKAALVTVVSRWPTSSFAVTKYCFALTNPQHAESHIRVGEFPGAERAFELAEIIALELGIEDGGKWLGWTVEVRSAQGRKLFSIPVAAGDFHKVPDAIARSSVM
jgi:hypothetical protein